MTQPLLDRFFRYVKIDTQSQEGVEDRYPSTEKQKDLSRLLVEELKGLGLEDAVIDYFGTVMATLPGNLPKEKASKAPVIGLLGHVDTSIVLAMSPIATNMTISQTTTSSTVSQSG